MFRQLEPGFLDDRDLVPQAIIGRAPSFFVRERNIHFIRGRDDLDDYVGADLLIKNDNLQQAVAVALRRYAGCPENTTTLYLPFDIEDVAIISGIVFAVLLELRIPTEWLEWQREDNPVL